MKHERWHKKDVPLVWNRRRTTFAVAQELFSSHEVDTGSKLLLRSIDVTSLPAQGHAIDFGCGYGVLGLAIQDALPGWTVGLVDRDALAVAFGRWNAERTGLDPTLVSSTVGLGVDLLPSTGADLVLWNVPGKAGELVLRHLTLDVAESLTEGGLAALVIVNPLAATIRDVLDEHPHVEIVVDAGHPEHTVIHARKSGLAVVPEDPFNRGVFDRDLSGFGVDDFDYDIVPVVGIPEYDSYSFATQVVFDLLSTIERPVHSLLVMRPGQGHVPLVATHKLQPKRVSLIDRDQLALRASERTLVDVLSASPSIDLIAAPDLADVPKGESFSLVILMLEEQVRNDLHLARISDLADLVNAGGQVIVGGTSSVVSRFLSFVAKSPGWKVRDRVKRSGASSARLERTG